MSNVESAGNRVPPHVRNHPGRLGNLAEIFLRRRIAAGIDSQGNVVLTRPGSIVVDGRDPDQRAGIMHLIAGIGADNKDVETRFEAKATGMLTVNVPVERVEISGEARWPIEHLEREVARFTDAGIRADLRYVFLGAQSVVPRLVGSSASWAGEMSFTGRTTTTSDGQQVMLTTAEPSTRPAFLRQPLDLDRPARPRVLVLDTGLRTRDEAGDVPEHPDLAAQELHVHIHKPWLMDPDIDAFDDEDEPDDDGSGTLDFEAGHGTFIAGIIRQHCPDAEIHPAGVLSSFGEGDVSHVLATIARMQAIDPPCGPFDIVVMSFGAFFADDEVGLFGDLLTAMLRGSLAVAAAGNQQTARPYFPAAIPGVVAVGGLEAGGKAWFSNFGGWVDACAPAVDIVSTFFLDFPTKASEADPRHWDGWARWSGTSFSAPKVAAVVAQDMYLNGGTAQESWKRLSSSKHFRYPDLGIVFNV